MGSGSSKDAKGKGFLRETLGDHEDTINCMSLSEDGSLLVTGSDDHTAQMWSTKTEETQCIGILKGHTSYVSCCAVCDRYVITGSFDSTVRKWDMASCECLVIYKGHSSRISRIIVTGEFIFSSSQDKTAIAWLFDAEDLTDEEGIANEEACVRTFSGHTKGIYPIIFIPAEDLPTSDEQEGPNINPGDLLITGSFDCRAKVWSFDTGACLKTFKGHTGPVTCMTTDNAGKTLFTGSYDQMIRSWDISTGKCLKIMEGHSGAIIAMLVVNRLMYTGSADGTARCWVTEFGDCTRVYKGHKHSVTALKFHEGVLFTACGDSCARAYDAKSQSLKRVYRGHGGAIQCLAVVDGKLYTGSSDATLRVWEAANLCDDPNNMDDLGDENTEFDQKQQQRLEELDAHLEDYVQPEDVNANKMCDDKPDVDTAQVDAESSAA